MKNKVVALYKQGHYADAIESYDRAIKIDPRYVLVRANKGNALKALHREYDAQRAFDKARGNV